MVIQPSSRSSLLLVVFHPALVGAALGVERRDRWRRPAIRSRNRTSLVCRKGLLLVPRRPWVRDGGCARCGRCPVPAFAGAVLETLIVFRIAFSVGRALDTRVLLLAGVVVSAFLFLARAHVRRHRVDAIGNLLDDGQQRGRVMAQLCLPRARARRSLCSRATAEIPGDRRATAAYLGTRVERNCNVAGIKYRATSSLAAFGIGKRGPSGSWDWSCRTRFGCSGRGTTARCFPAPHWRAAHSSSSLMSRRAPVAGRQRAPDRRRDGARRGAGVRLAAPARWGRVNPVWRDRSASESRRPAMGARSRLVPT